MPTQPQQQQQPLPKVTLTPPPGLTVEPPDISSQKKAEVGSDNGLIEGVQILSPMSGTFYRYFIFVIF